MVAGFSHASDAPPVPPGTTVISKGCMAVVPQELAVGQKLRLINNVNQNSSEAALIWRGHQGPSGWELGLELFEPPPDYWGLDF